MIKMEIFINLKTLSLSTWTDNRFKWNKTSWWPRLSSRTLRIKFEREWNLGYHMQTKPAQVKMP